MLDASPPSRYPTPMTVAKLAEVARVDLDLCDRCGLCLPLCPPEAIHLQFNILLIDGAACTGCHKCIAPCPVRALAMVPA